MRKKKWIQMVGMTALLLMLWGCGAKEEAQSEETREAEGLVIEDDSNTYQFVDVRGKKYEAELLDNVPLCNYDMERITEENGYKYYQDEDGTVISRLGIDVSKYQEEIDWNQVKDAGIDYAMIRLGYRGYGDEGTLVEDTMFRQHIEDALAAGLDVGVYFFSQAVNEEEVLEEAQFVLERIKDYEITCPVVFDTEEITYDTARTDELTAEEFTGDCITFCDTIQEAGYDTMIYANMKWMAFTLALTELTEYAKWYADYEPLPQCPYAFSMWQYTETGTVPGIEGNVDLNVWFPENED